MKKITRKGNGVKSDPTSIKPYPPASPSKAEKVQPIAEQKVTKQDLVPGLYFRISQYTLSGTAELVEIFNIDGKLWWSFRAGSDIYSNIDNLLTRKTVLKLIEKYKEVK